MSVAKRRLLLPIPRVSAPFLQVRFSRCYDLLLAGLVFAMSDSGDHTDSHLRNASQALSFSA
ncbi:hypothetical protein LMG24076_02588 [Trinickia soli]|nr:hypothetical protein LMG24076_02588 [Trinickia soli]